MDLKHTWTLWSSRMMSLVSSICEGWSSSGATSWRDMSTLCWLHLGSNLTRDRPLVEFWISNWTMQTWTKKMAAEALITRQLIAHWESNANMRSMTEWAQSITWLSSRSTRWSSRRAALSRSLSSSQRTSKFENTNRLAVYYHHIASCFNVSFILKQNRQSGIMGFWGFGLFKVS